MIIDLEKFVAAEQGYWNELETRLDALDFDRSARGALDLSRAERLHYLYQRAASDLARLATFSAEGELRRTLGALVARAYAEIHAHSGTGGERWQPLAWLTVSFPRAFRRHLRAFWLAVAVTVVGAGFGGLAVGLDPEAKAVILPFPQLLGDPRRTRGGGGTRTRRATHRAQGVVFGSVDDEQHQGGRRRARAGVGVGVGGRWW